MINVFVDTETYSEALIKVCGVHKYAAHSSAEIMLISYAIDDGPVELIDCTKNEKGVFEFADMVAGLGLLDDVTLIAHNAAFDRIMFARYSVLQDVRWECTRTKAYRAGLPGGLQILCDLFKLSPDQAKQKEGKDLIQLFCVPHPSWAVKRATRLTHPEKWEIFVEYAKHDILAMRSLYKKIPNWNDLPFEDAILELDQRMNDRGFPVDVELAKKAIIIQQQQNKESAALITQATDGAVTAATQRDKILHFILEEYGVSLPDLSKSTLERRLNDPDLSEAAKALIRMRLNNSKSSVSKYKALLNREIDGRIYGALTYGGARTLRWTGNGFQPQNLPRITFSLTELKSRLSCIEDGSLDLVYDNPSGILSSVLRAAIKAPAGKQIVVADLAAIEGRGLAWLAGDRLKIKQYKDGKDVYVANYVDAFGGKPEDVTKTQRQIGKVEELAFGYAGGVHAVLSFLVTYSVDIPSFTEHVLDHAAPDLIQRATDSYTKYGCTQYDIDQDVYVACEALKLAWRKANPRVVKFWNDLQNAVEAAASTGACIQVGKLVVGRKRNYVAIQLPSGRYMLYPGMRVVDNNNRRSLAFKGISPYSHKWDDIYTHGGKLAENVTQAVSRDILAVGLLEAEKAELNPILSTHDEIICETDDSLANASELLVKAMTAVPEWASGFPLAAVGSQDQVYFKQ